MVYTKGKKPTADETQEMFEAIRETALDQQADGLRKLGVSEAAIVKAKAECIKQNNDKPLMALARIMLGLRQ
jgi:hypothetical protein